MNQTATEPSQRLDEKRPFNSPIALPSELLVRIQSLYDSGLCRQAYDLACSSGPLDQLRGVDAMILAGRIALNLGATRLTIRQHVRAFHAAPEKIRVQAYYLEAFLAMRGPMFAWQTFKRLEQDKQSSFDDGTSDDGATYLFSLAARICGHLRDFEQAEEWLKKAEERRTDSPWLLVERSTLLTMQEQWKEGLKTSRRALEIRPWYRPAVQQLAHCLHTLNQDKEALQFLEEATQRIESLPVLNQLAGLQMDLELYAEAMVTLDRAGKFSPILDRANQNWIAAQRCRAACALEDYAQAEASGSQLNDDYHRGLLERLRNESKKSRRIQLSIPFIQQFRLTCVPATLTMLFRFWKLPADHVEVAEAICYDGTPSHRARRWAEANGMIAREFTLDWNLAVALLDRQIPFAVYTTEATSAHVQVVAGYDELRRTFILRNPAFPQVQEVFEEQFLKHYAASGPAGMVLVPAGMKNLLEGLNFPDADLYDRLRTIQQALEEHRRSDAGAQFLEMQSKAPRHWLTLTAGRALYSYDTNSPALMECLDKLLVLFPQDGNLLLAKLGILREIGRREERLELLRNICARKEADPVFRQQLAHELMADARQYPEAQLALKKAMRFQPLNAYTITTLANLYWNQRHFDEALDLYRHAACLEDKKEPPASTYFAAANARKQTEAALAFLQRRWELNSAKSPAPFITWFGALRQIGRSREALNRLEEILRDKPEHGELWLTAADTFARHGNFERADQCLATAEGHVQRAQFLRIKADLARYRADPKAALSLWREALQIEPLSMVVHRSLVWVLAESEGREVALKYLQQVCERFPHHYQLHQLWAEWARGAGPEIGEIVTHKLVEVHPTDAWARRQLALVLTDAARFDEALGEAEEGVRLAPQQPVSLATRAHVRLGLGQTAEAQEDFREAIRLSVDYSAAIHGLVNSFGTVSERREALAFVEKELVRQVVFGDGLRAYRDAARLNLEPKILLSSLRAALRERPDLLAAWSVVVHQLAEMLELDEALTLAQEASERFPLQEQAWLDLALVHRLRLDAKSEQSALEQAMRISPASSVPARMLAQFYERSGETARSKELLEEACVRSPFDAYSHGALAMVLWRQGSQQAALEKMRHALKVQPGYNWGWQTLASWSAAVGQPNLAEELAKIMVLQRPGEIHSILVLARLLASTKRLGEALQVVNQALNNFQRNAEAHELRAEILAALGKHAEADDASEPQVWGTRSPATLRACRARLEAQRGNLVSAIERMKAVLLENPGYAAGWQNLADWLWQRKQHEEAVAAITNVRRLDPSNPVPLGYRASMKLQKNDRAGGRADLELALKYDPAYSFASLNLFDLQLADADINGARHTLELIQRSVGGEKAKACEVKLRTKFLQISANQPSQDRKQMQQLRAHEMDQAFARLKDLCSSKESAGENFDMAIRALLDAGQTKRVEQLLVEVIKLPDCNPAVGVWWMRRRLAHGKWYCTGYVNRLCPKSAAARRAVITLIESLGDQKRFASRTILLAYFFITLTKLIERQIRAFALLWLAWRHHSWLRSDNHGWASMGFALVKLQRFRTAIWWMRDWRERSELKMWMLLNLALALRVHWRWQEARDVLDRAVKLPERDHTFQKLRLMLAMEQALIGNTQEAAGHFRELDASGWTGYMLIQYHYTKGLIAVQQAARAEKKKIFRAERTTIRKVLAQHRTSTFRADYRRCLTRMAKDAGQRWMIIPIWMGV